VSRIKKKVKVLGPREDQSQKAERNKNRGKRKKEEIAGTKRSWLYLALSNLNPKKKRSASEGSGQRKRGTRPCSQGKGKFSVQDPLSKKKTRGGREEWTKKTGQEEVGAKKKGRGANGISPIFGDTVTSGPVEPLKIQVVVRMLGGRSREEGKFCVCRWSSEHEKN